MEDINQLKQKTISGLFWKFSERITAQLITFIVSIILARLITPSEYGVVAIVTIFITIANVFVTNGLGTSLIQKKNSDNKDFSTMFYAGLVIAIIIYIIIFLIAPLISIIYKNDTLTLMIRVMGLRIPVAAINSIQHAYVSKKMIYKKFFFSTLFGTIISAFVGIYCAYIGLGAWAIIYQYLTNTIIDTIVLFITLDWKPSLYFSRTRFNRLFPFCWKIMVTGFIGTLFSQLRSLLIGIKYQSSTLAYYNKGEQIPSLITNNIDTSIESVLFPTFSSIQDNLIKMKEVVRKTMKLSCYVVLPILLGIAACAKPLISLLLTDKWLPCVPFLQIFCIQYGISILNTINIQAIKSLGQGGTLLKLESIKKPLYLAIIVVGMIISPYAMAIGNLIYNIIAIIINSLPNKKYLNYTLKEQVKDLLPTILISIVMSLLVLSLSLIDFHSNILLILIQITVGFISYLLLSIAFKNDNLIVLLNIIKNIIKKAKKKNNYLKKYK